MPKRGRSKKPRRFAAKTSQRMSTRDIQRDRLLGREAPYRMPRAIRNPVTKQQALIRAKSPIDVQIRKVQRRIINKRLQAYLQHQRSNASRWEQIATAHKTDRRDSALLRNLQKRNAPRRLLSPCQRRAQRKAVLLAIGKVSKPGGAPGPYKRTPHSQDKCQ